MQFNRQPNLTRTRLSLFSEKNSSNRRPNLTRTRLLEKQIKRVQRRPDLSLNTKRGRRHSSIASSTPSPRSRAICCIGEHGHERVGLRSDVDELHHLRHRQLEPVFSTQILRKASQGRSRIGLQVHRPRRKQKFVRSQLQIELHV